MRILLVKRDKIGDLVLTTAIIDHLAATLPDIEIHLLANDYNAWVVAGMAALRRLWVYPRVRHGGRLRLGAALAQVPLAIALRRMRFEWAIAMNGEESPRALRRALAVGARRTAGYASALHGYGKRLTDALPAPAEGHELARMVALLAPLGVAAPRTWPAPSCAIPAVDRDRAHAWLAAEDLQPGAYLFLGLGARWPHKQPDAAQVVRWVRAWHDRWGLPTVLSWTPGDRTNPLYPGDDAIAHAVLAHGLPFVHPYVGTMEVAAALVQGARTTLVPDSGLMHVAAASPGGVLGLFALGSGMDDPARWHPVGPRARWLVATDAVSALDDETVLQALAPLAHAATSPSGVVQA